MEYELYVNKTVIKKHKVVISARKPTGEVCIVQVCISPPLNTMLGIGTL